jgi:anti-sigma factor RsiW
MSFSCTDKETLVAYLYDECDEGTRHAVEAHLHACPACADEVRGFARVRETLAQWEPPNRVGEYKLVRDTAVDAPPAKVLRPARWWQQTVPALARVAAAILLFAGGAALANLDIRYDKDGFAVRTGWQTRPPVAATATARAAEAPAATAGPQVTPTAAPMPAAVAPTTVAMAPAAAQASSQPNAPWRIEMAALERNLREEFHQQLVAARAAGASGAVSPLRVSAETDLGEGRLMEQVHALIDESSRRQQVWVAYRISQMERDLQAQRKTDMARVQTSFGQLDGPPVYLPEQKQMMNYIRLNPVTLKK